MASLSRKGSLGGGGVGKKVHRKRPTRQDAPDDWDFSLDSERRRPITNGTSRPPPPPEYQDVEDALLPDTSTSVDQAVAPLRAMAERVGREVETFAQTLDQFFNDLPTRNDRFEAAYELVLRFRDIANDVVQDMKGRHERELREQLRNEWSEQARMSAASNAFGAHGTSTSAALSAKKAEQIKELRSWQQEADMWDLFGIMLELHPFEADAQQRQQETEDELAILGVPHRYTSEADLWKRFILENRLARERDQIKQWLERTTEHQQSDLGSILEELEAKAGGGKGLWSSGWLHTRERIKGEKRLRPWPDASASPLPQIRRTDNNELLVTTLDPDAASRQQRTLEKSDAYFERAIWIACWEMLRRGNSWQEVCNWCEDRKEAWRAVAIGAATDNDDVTSSTAAFRHICRTAARSAAATEHESAVFGLLGGDMKTVERVCRTVDDRLYAYYSVAVLKQYDNYLLDTCPDKAVPTPWRRNIADDSTNNEDQAAAAIQRLIMELRTGLATSKEAAQPMKIIQSYLLADEVGSLVHTVGTAIAATAALQGPEDVIFLRDRSTQDLGPALPETEVALDPQTLRMAAHMSIVHRVLSPEHLESLGGDELLEDENVLVAYIQALRAAGKRDMIPMYASRLQRSRSIIVLGRFLQDITTVSEQEHMLGLFREYDLDIKSIILDQLRWIVTRALGEEEKQWPLRMLERTEETKLHPGQRIIVDFLSGEKQPYDDEIVSALRWYQHLPHAWKVMFDAMAVTLRKCLINGRLTCARMIVAAFPYEELCLQKTYEELGRSVNLMDLNNAQPDSAEEALHWNLLRGQSQSYFELTVLVDAMEALREWRIQEHKYVTMVPTPPTVPSALKHAYLGVSAAMEPLLQGIFQQPQDEEEEKDMSFFRESFVPEIVIAYNTVLHAAGNLITRDSLLESMELSAMIANGQTESGINGLLDCFVRAGRMRELVQSFALTSKLMLLLHSTGREWKAKKANKGMDLAMWELGRVQQQNAAASAEA